MRKLTIANYEDAIKNALTHLQREKLLKLYEFEGHTATAKEFAIANGYSGFGAANMIIGAIGKRIAEYIDIQPDEYYRGANDKRKAYHTLVGPYKANVGWIMEDNLVKALENLGFVGNNNEIIDYLPTEILESSKSESFVEGKVIQVLVDRFERNTRARELCIEKFGAMCQVCQFDFEKVYGQFASGYIQVHHKKPLSEIGKSYEVNPLEDLIPLCANCHVAVHIDPNVGVEELKRIIKRSMR